MHVVRDGNVQGVQRLFLVEHFSEVLVEGRVGVLGAEIAANLFVRIAEGDDVFGRAGPGVAVALAAAADHRDVEFVIGGHQAGQCPAATLPAARPDK